MNVPALVTGADAVGIPLAKATDKPLTTNTRTVTGIEMA
jgi:hypothetical protein